MALDPILWALKDAPVRTPIERLVLTIYAEYAEDDGCSAYPSYATVAERALCDRKTVERTVRELTRRGLLGRGDQAAAAAIPTRYRPVVRDVLVPYAWWGLRGVERVNRYRADRGRPALTTATRPDPEPPAPRTRRGDAGQPRPRQGGLSVPSDAGSQGGLSVPGRGDSQSPVGGTLSPPTNPSNPPTNPPTYLTDHAAAGAERRDPGQAGRESEDHDPVADPHPPAAAPAGDPHATAAAGIVTALPWPAGNRPDRRSRDRLIAAAARCLAAGHSPGHVTRTATGGIPGARQPAAVVLARLRDLATETPAPTAGTAGDERERLARTPHPHKPGRTAGYCADCGRHETNRVHRGAGDPSTTAARDSSPQPSRVDVPLQTRRLTVAAA